MPERPRYTNLNFPPYSYVPGHNPHPLSDPDGHMFGQECESPLPLLPTQWESCQEYLFGVDLFNFGFYWEAHESWESIWHAAGRSGTVANFLKGLIKLAAAGVKAREGNPAGVSRHARRSVELLQSIQQDLDTTNQYCGLDIVELVAATRILGGNPQEIYTEPKTDLLLDVWLQLPTKGQ